MASESHRGRARRAWLIAGAALGVMLGGPVVAAPSVEATCDTVLELAAIAGESDRGSDRGPCLQYYEDQRARRGVLGWTSLSWCTWAAQSIPEAGEC